MGSFVGILLFASHNNKSSIESSTTQEYYFGILMITLATLGMVVIAICLRIINQHIHATISPFYVSISNSVGMFILLAFSTKFFNIEHYTTFDILMFLTSGIIDYPGQLFKSLAYKYGDASVVTPFIYFQMVFLFLADVFIFKYEFSTNDLLGGILVTFCLLSPIFIKLIKMK